MNKQHIYHLSFPAEVTNQPIVNKLIKNYDVELNILKGGVDANRGGYLILEFTGEEANILSSLQFLKSLKIVVEENASRLKFNKELCVDCGACTGVCFVGALSLDTEHRLVFESKKCISCGLCIKACPLKLFKLL